MSVAKLPLELALLAIGIPASAAAIELQRETLDAWNTFSRQAEADMQARAEGARPFLWIDEGSAARGDLRARLRRGETIAAPLSGRGTLPVPNGLIHHWIGAVFIPNATVGALLSVVHNYASYKDIYQPVVADSKVLACSGSEQRFSMIWQRKILFLDAAMEGQYQAREFLGSGRGYTIAATTRVREIQNFGQRGEQMLPPDEGIGFLWRVESIARFEEADGGVYLELEAMALTRDVPSSLRWLVNPVVNRLSITSLTTTLRQTRDAVVAAPPQVAQASGLPLDQTKIPHRVSTRPSTP